MRFLFYGIFSDPVELTHLGWRDRSELLEAAGRRNSQSSWGRTHRRWYFLVLMAMIVPLVCFLLPPSDAVWGLMFGSQVASLIGLVWLQIADARHRHAMLQTLLLERGIRPARCFRCRYDLRDSTSDACPECGDAIVKLDKNQV
jgi:hypothetical protein